MNRSIFFLLFSSLLIAKEQPFCVQTSHKLVIDDQTLIYTATVSSIPIRDNEGKIVGDLYFTSYCMDDLFGINQAERPITFCFDGGPGASSSGLHICGLGPKRALTVEEGQSITAPYRYIDNRFTLLTHTDLVFIDPPGTGCSRITDEDLDPSLFYDSINDIQTIGDFICDYLSSENRWLSPKYIAGSSYGTYRACGLSAYLMNQGVALNGALLLSCAIDLTTLGVGPNSEIPLILFLPSYAAAAWAHGRFLPETSLEEVLKGVHTFAWEKLAPSLFLNGSISPAFYENLSYWTGLSLDEIQWRDGMVDSDLFLIRCCAPEKKAISRYDTRVVGDLLPPRTLDHYIDPLVQRTGLYMATFYAYLKEELNCHIDWPRYRAFSSEAFSRWRWGSLSMLDMLQKTMVANPEMRLFIGSGYFDLATPFAATDYTFKRLQIPFADRIIFRYYEGGHCFFSHPKILKQFKEDLAKFYEPRSY